MDDQKHILQASNEDKAAQAARIKKMKTDLTSTNFKLGKKNKINYYKMIDN